MSESVLSEEKGKRAEQHATTDVVHTHYHEGEGREGPEEGVVHR
jgi:hypothetical protein